MKLYGHIFYFLLLAFFLSSCSAIEGIFKAGVWVGVLGVMLVLGLIIYFVMRARK